MRYEPMFRSSVEDLAALARVQADLAAARPASESLMLSARVKRQLEQQVSALAARRGMSRSALVRELLENAVAADSQELAA